MGMPWPISEIDGFWNEKNESVYWINFDGRDAETLPPYNDLAVSLMSFDRIVVEYRHGEQLKNWLTQDGELHELLQSDAVVLLTDAYTNNPNGIEHEYSHGEENELIGKLVNRKLNAGLFISQYPSDFIDDDEERAIWPYDRLAGGEISNVNEKYSNLKLAMVRNFTVSSYPQFESEFSFMPSPFKFVEVALAQKTRNAVSNFFGIPHPVRPSAEQVLEFRSMDAHKEYRNFMDKIFERAKEGEKVAYFNNHIIDEITHVFERDIKKSGTRNFVEAVVCTGVDLISPVPIGNAYSVARAGKTAAKKGKDKLSWRSFFRKWDSQKT